MMKTINFVIFLIFLLTKTSSQQRSSSLTIKNDNPFNVDLDFPIEILNHEAKNIIFQKLRSPQGQSMFGASVTADNNVVFIGAPKLKSKNDPSLLTGSVFRCSFDLTKNDNYRCTEINFLQCKSSFT